MNKSLTLKKLIKKIQKKFASHDPHDVILKLTY